VDPKGGGDTASSFCNATAKVRRKGRCQTLERPDGFEPSADEVWVGRDDASGDIILTPKPSPPRPDLLARLFPRDPVEDWS
jgi:antitoxin VapB